MLSTSTINTVTINAVIDNTVTINAVIDNTVIDNTVKEVLNMSKLLKMMLAFSLVMVVVSVAMPLSTVSAATVKAITITQAQINSSYAVTHPNRRSVNSTSVLLNEGSVSITQNVTPRSQATREVVSVWTPKIVANGRDLYWVLQSATVNGEPVSASYITEVNYNGQRIMSSVINAAIRQVRKGGYVINSVTISPAGIVVTITY
jgi:hypothetical protein